MLLKDIHIKESILLRDAHIGQRTAFHNTWLTEMPSGSGIFPAYEPLVKIINQMADYDGAQIIKLDNNLNRLIIGKSIWYWYGDINNIQLCTELNVEHEAVVVRLTGKDPKLKGKPPFASDLYSTILKDLGENIRLRSDTYLSDEGLGIWKKLFQLGHKILIYDSKQPGQSYKPFKDISEFDEYFKHDSKEHERYQYVLSESSLRLAEIHAHFNIRKYWEDAGHSLIDP